MKRQNPKINKKNKIGNRKAGSRTTMSKQLASHPKSIVNQSIRTFKIRCLASAAINGYQVLMSDISGMLGVIAKSATTSQYLSSLTRLRKVIMWGPVATAGTPVTVNLTWSNNSEDFETPPVTKSDTSISFDHPAFLDVKPPRQSLTAKWHSSGLADSLFVFGCPAGTTVDFEIDWVLCDGPNTVYVAGPTLIAATAGNIYHHPFSNLVAQGLNSL
jgi:hypothetical protein